MSPHRTAVVRRRGIRHILLVRHGQSVWNAERRWQGQADSPLTPAGRTAASELADHLRTIVRRPGGRVWASTLSRARETAEIVARRLDAEVTLDPRLVERHAGPWQGLTTEEIDARWPGARQTSAWPEGAEPFAAVHDRAAAALADIAGRHPEDHPPVVVTHGGVIRILLQMTGGSDRPVPNLGGAWFAVDGDRIVAGPSFPSEPTPQPTADGGEPDGDRL